LPVRSWEASSAKVVSRTWCRASAFTEALGASVEQPRNRAASGSPEGRPLLVVESFGSHQRDRHHLGKLLSDGTTKRG
jgi:hypothetical protein